MSTVSISSDSENDLENGDAQAELLLIATTLVSQLEANQFDEANQTIYQLCQLREGSLFQEIGKLTREMHESLNSFAHDESLETLMHESLPDAKKRLDYVVQLTEESAHKTLNAVEQCMPVTAELKQGAEILQQQVSDNNMQTFLAKAVSHSETLNSCLTEILMAQTFQDVTGQIIQRVIKLVKDVEDSLVSMIRACSSADINTGIQNGNLMKEEKDNRGYGPAVPGVNQGEKITNENETVKNQDDVDDLLSTLGF